MSRGSQAALAVVSAVLLAAFALLFPRSESEPRIRSQEPRPIVAERRALESEARAQVERSTARAAVRRAAREDPQDERGPRPRDRRRIDRLRGQLVPLGERFFAAFAGYELGETDRKAWVALRETTARAFGRELAGAAPRPVSGRPAKLARLVRLELVPGVVDRGRIVASELVGLVRRGDRTGPIAIEVRLTPEGWRVAGLGQ